MIKNRISSALLMALIFLTGDLFASETLVLRNTVIKKDTVWTGNVVVEGVVVVGRKATLTIQPGTVVRFKKIDTDLDGIGDSEIRVLGKLLAVGSQKAPIFFQSAEKTPQPKDWSYLLIFSSSEINKIQFCQFRHGFTGLQVQFSTATVSDCLFEDNNEGIRFGRAKLTISGNIIQKNNIGIRFTRMEGPVEIRHNQINANRVGIFLVPSGQNIRDFFQPGRGGTAWNEGHLTIAKNNISNNSEYNLKLGAKQMWDLNVSENWWGTTALKEIRETIFDKFRDDELGEALIEPIAKQEGILAPQ